MPPKTLYIDDPTVKECTIADARACAMSLALAFAQDDVAFYCLETPDNGGRTRDELWPVHLRFMEWLVKAHAYSGLVLSTGPNHEGVALWHVSKRCLPPCGSAADWKIGHGRVMT